MILRGCPRCGGDVLTRDARNVRCLQCGHRPELPIAELRRRGRLPRARQGANSLRYGCFVRRAGWIGRCGRRCSGLRRRRFRRALPTLRRNRRDRAGKAPLTLQHLLPLPPLRAYLQSGGLQAGELASIRASSPPRHNDYREAATLQRRHHRGFPQSRSSSSRRLRCTVMCVRYAAKIA